VEGGARGGGEGEEREKGVETRVGEREGGTKWGGGREGGVRGQGTEGGEAMRDGDEEG